MKYWQKVRVKSWFYEGMEGIVINKLLWFYQIRYGKWDREPYGEVMKREFLTTFLIKKSDLEIIL